MRAHIAMYGIAIIAALWAVLFVYNLLTASGKVKGRLGENQTEAAVESGSDAVETVGDRNAEENSIDVKVKGTNDAIRNANDAAGVDDALRARLCNDNPACQ